MSENMGIYKITNTKNGKFYIGSSVDLKKRRRDHFRELKNGIHCNERLQHSFNKYGKENFKFEIIQFVSDRDKLIEAEQLWIDKMDASNRYIGFNINQLASGGGNYGETNGNYGNTSINNPLSKQIAQIDVKTLEVVRIWGASIDILREKGWHSGNICQVCIHLKKNNSRKIYKGFYWCYEDDINLLRECEDFVGLQERRVLKIDKLTNEVICEYESVVAAASSVGVKPENITRVCKGKNMTSGGFVWKYEKEEYAYEVIKRNDMKNTDNPRARKVAKLSVDGSFIEVYGTIKQACESNGVSTASVYVNLNRGLGHITGGFKWMYYEEYLKLNTAQGIS